ncbi:hypothetical protein [uncultured Thiodictyon sp.]|uniref:hypothetical protein n=1 Tax=uncultured Thiodictyon sp. TaxID=1846217 RepID=UPI0025E25D44|nr:hypothetical protein [uncultured Thiodictyon sp.]
MKVPHRPPDPSDADLDDDWGELREDPGEAQFQLGDLVSPPERLTAPPRGVAAPPQPFDPAHRVTRTAAPHPGGWGEQTKAGAFFDTQPAPFAHYRGVQQLGIIGGKGVGKSYLFQAMVYRVQHARTAGALSYFLDSAGVELVTTRSPDVPARTVNLQRFNGDYERWTRLGSTLATHQPWYRLALPYRTGLLGRSRSALEVEFFDGSGEQFFEPRDPNNRALWEQAYRAATVMVFCLPLWAVFPGTELSSADWRERESILESFHAVVQNYKDMRRQLGLRQPVRSLLALTMADDRRGGLTRLRDTWIGGYLQQHQAFLMQTRTGRGIARYLANARRVSEVLRAEFAAAPSPGIAGIPDLLRLGAGRPWLIALSAIHGEALDQLELAYPNPDERPPRLPPIPAHVELPLLVALCERANALM